MYLEPSQTFTMELFAKIVNHIYIVRKGDHTTPFLRFPPFLEIQDVPTFHMSIGKAKVLNNFCKQFVHNSYPQRILILEECLQKW